MWQEHVERDGYAGPRFTPADVDDRDTRQT
jgi:hypothetical protein